MSTSQSDSEWSQRVANERVRACRFLSMAELAAQASTTKWLWQGYLARENITLLTSQWKTGKTTLLAALLAQLNTGGELGGLPVMPGRALIVSEEAPDLWAK